MMSKNTRYNFANKKRTKAGGIQLGAARLKRTKACYELRERDWILVRTNQVIGSGY